MRFRGALHFLVRTLSTGGTDFARTSSRTATFSRPMSARGRMPTTCR